MSGSLAKRVVFVARLLIAAGMVIIVGMEYVRPLVADIYYRDEYRRLAAECDLAMHDEAALRVGTVGAHKDPALTTSADVALGACHQYDKLRKKMLILGVSEEQLALHGLEALETELIPVSRMVEPHRMERF